MRNLEMACGFLDQATRAELDALRPVELERLRQLLLHWAGLAERRHRELAGSRGGVLSEMQNRRDTD